MGSNYSSNAKKDIILISLGSVLSFIGFILFAYNIVLAFVFIITGVSLIGVYASKFKSDKINQDCQVSDWSTCSTSCGGGSQTRTITQQSSGSGSECPTLSQSCNTTPCNPVDCQVSWSDWDSCSASCGGGIQTKTGTITQQPQNGGASCPTDLTQTQACNTSPCSIDCQVSEWSNWSDCSTSCGDGTQTRTRYVTVPPQNGGASCPLLIESQPCNKGACPVDCQVSWSNWNSCSASCGGGIQTKTGTITQQPLNGGASCPTDLTQSQACNTQACPNWTSVGCYIDSSTRVLPNQLATSTTLANCKSLAVSKGYNVIGLQNAKLQSDGTYKSECWADKSSNYPTNPTFYAKLGPTTNCISNMGGSWSNSIYKY